MVSVVVVMWCRGRAHEGTAMGAGRSCSAGCRIGDQWQGKEGKCVDYQCRMVIINRGSTVKAKAGN